MADGKQARGPVDLKFLVACAIGISLGLGLCGVGAITPNTSALQGVLLMAGATIFVLCLVGFAVTCLVLIAIKINERFHK